MKKLHSHYQDLLNWGFFSAPRTPIKPAYIHPGEEKVEIITAGKVFFTDGNGIDREYGCGTIFWHCSGEYTVYRTPPNDPYRCFHCTFQVSSDERMVPRIGSWGGTPELNMFVNDMLNLRTRQSSSEAVFLYTLGVLLRQMAGGDPAEKLSLPANIQKVCNLMSADPTRDFSVNDLAEAVNLSSSRFFTVFRQHLGCSPHQWMLRRKISLAKELLVSRPDMPIKQVAESCGFFNLEVFYRRFRQHTGVSPKQFRLRHGRSETISPTVPPQF